VAPLPLGDRRGDLFVGVSHRSSEIALVGLRDPAGQRVLTARNRSSCRPCKPLIRSTLRLERAARETRGARRNPLAGASSPVAGSSDPDLGQRAPRRPVLSVSSSSPDVRSRRADARIGGAQTLQEVARGALDGDYGPRVGRGRAPNRLSVRERGSVTLATTPSRPVARRDRSYQAIAKAEIVSGNAARLGRSVHLCLCKTPGQDRLAALLLVVQGEARSRPATHSPPTADEGVLRCPGCRP
jgi:hypothetical protein